MTGPQRFPIARVGENDLSDLLPLMRAYCEFYEVTPTDEKLLALARALIADPAREGVQFIAREASGRAVGFATVYWSWATTEASRIGVMNDLFGSPTARGHGVAGQLIDACRAECARRRIQRLTWQTAVDNLSAQALYERMGATREQWIDYWLAC